MAKRSRRSRVSETGASSAGELEGTLKALRKEYGDHVVSRGSEIVHPHRIPTGVFMLDFATLGGIPYNRITMLAGERASGKSMLSDMIIGNVQRMMPDQVAVKIDIENAHDPIWSEKLGVDQDELLLVQPEAGEAAVDAATSLVKTKEVSLVVVDSIAALTPLREVESLADDAHVAIQARMVGAMIRKLTSGLIAERNRGHYVTVIFINQFRVGIGIMFGDNRVLPGGKALEYSTSLQIILKNKEQFAKDDNGLDRLSVNEHVFDIKKNRMNAGIRHGEFRVCRAGNEDTGLTEGDVDDAGTVLAYAKRFGLYTGGGSHWTLAFREVEEGFSRAADAQQYLYDNPEVKIELQDELIALYAETLHMPAEFVARYRDSYGDRDDYEE